MSIDGLLKMDFPVELDFPDSTVIAENYYFFQMGWEAKGHLLVSYTKC